MVFAKRSRLLALEVERGPWAERQAGHSAGSDRRRAAFLHQEQGSEASVAVAVAVVVAVAVAVAEAEAAAVVGENCCWSHFEARCYYRARKNYSCLPHPRED